MQKWEYRRFFIDRDEKPMPHISDKLNTYGEEGWELVSETMLGTIDNPFKWIQFTFKRPKIDYTIPKSETIPVEI